MNGFRLLSCLLRPLFVKQSQLAAENLALRQQLAIYQQRLKRPRLRTCDRIFWVWLSRLWPDWRHALVIVPREQEPPDRGEVFSIQMVGGLHHRYMRRAASAHVR